MSKPPPSRTPICHPYARISDPEQRQGGGLVRQTLDPGTAVRVAEFCRLYGFTLSNRMLVDDGVSAFHGLNATPDHELGKFLGEAGRGLVLPGDCLLLENWDRLSRQDIWAAIGLVNDLRQLGIHVGRLDRMKLLRCDSTDPGDFFEAAVELMRGHSESAAKSMRNGAAWERKRAAARASGKPMTRRLPAWLELRDGKAVLIPGRAAVVKRIFSWAAAGYGIGGIIKKLTAEGVPPFGKSVVREGRERGAFSGRWVLSYVASILRDRRAAGEYQPRGKNREPEGPPIPGYFPAVVTDAEYWAARAAVPSGGEKKTRRGKHLDLFAGLIQNARTGEPYYSMTRATKDKPGLTRALVASGRREGRTPASSFPVPVFEAAVLSCLREIDPHSILNGDRPPDETTALAAEAAGVEAEVAKLGADLDANGYSKVLSEQVRRQEARLADLNARLAEARQRAAHPVSEAWGECRTLIDVLENSPDPADTRLRLRAAIGRIVDGVWLLVVAPTAKKPRPEKQRVNGRPPRPGRDRLAAVQIWFAGGKKQRTYLVFNRAAGFYREASWWCRSLAEVHQPADLDLRDPRHARDLEAVLLALDLTADRP
jgi:DNA invertase Pin-like site-specific DNA recombinase